MVESHPIAGGPSSSGGCPGVAHGVADADVDLLFFPKLLDLPDPAGPGGKTCPLEQALPELVEQAVKAKRGSGQMQVLRPRLALQGGFTGAGVLRALSKTLASLAPSRLRRLPKPWPGRPWSSGPIRRSWSTSAGAPWTSDGSMACRWWWWSARST